MPNSAGCIFCEPLGSLLKFRLPWADGVTEYLAGAVALPVWGPPTTTESRLIVPSPALSRSMQVLREDGVSSSPAKLKMCAIIRAAVNTEVEHVAATRSAENRRSSGRGCNVKWAYNNCETVIIPNCTLGQYGLL